MAKPGCATCPGQSGVLGQMQQLGYQATDADMVLVEYIGTETKRYFRGIGSRQRYPFGTCIGCKERYVLREDLGGFLADPARFIVHLDNTNAKQLANVVPITSGDGAVSGVSANSEDAGSGI